jgi:hypothetical protein
VFCVKEMKADWRCLPRNARSMDSWVRLPGVLGFSLCS